MVAVARALKGHEKLWKVFWIYGLAAILVPQIIFMVLGDRSFLMNLKIMALLIDLSLMWWLVSTWRCAFNVDRRFWGYLARIYVLMLPVMIYAFGFLALKKFGNG